MILPTILLLFAIAPPAQNAALSLAPSADPVICPPHCLECTDELTCTRCDQTTHWKVSPDHLCVCGDSFYPSNDTCEPCSLGCLSCTAPSPCLACDTANHFQPADDLCVCMDTFVLSNSACESCSALIEGCLRCTSNTTCTVCQDNYDFVYATHSCKEKQDGTIKVVTFGLLGVMVVVGGVLFVGSKLRKDKVETMLEPEEKEDDSEAEHSQNEQ